MDLHSINADADLILAVSSHVFFLCIGVKKTKFKHFFGTPEKKIGSGFLNYASLDLSFIFKFRFLRREKKNSCFGLNKKEKTC